MNKRIQLICISQLIFVSDSSEEKNYSFWVKLLHWIFTQLSPSYIYIYRGEQKVLTFYNYQVKPYSWRVNTLQQQCIHLFLYRILLPAFSLITLIIMLLMFRFYVNEVFEKVLLYVKLERLISSNRNFNN